MHDRIFGIYRNRVEKALREMRSLVFKDSYPLHGEFAKFEGTVSCSESKDLVYKEISEGENWGKAWENAWFHLTGKVPENLAGQELCLQLNLGCETMVYGPDGVPQCGLTASSIYATGYVKDRFIIGSKKAGDALDFRIEANAYALWGVDRDAIHPYGYLMFGPTVTAMRVCAFDREMWNLILDLEQIFSILNYEKDPKRTTRVLLDAANRALDVFAGNPSNASKARSELAEVLSWPARGSSLHVYAVGHAHIDVAWLWPIRESRRKAGRTFANQLELMDRYPDYVFGASQAYLYQAVKEDYPGLYEKIRRRVAEGRWEVQGGMWVEADANIISGESMVRQFLHGKNFFMDEFGIDVKNLWLPDVFGYPASMPQIIRRSGCEYFLTQKLSWNQVNTIDANTFLWQGVDGSEVLTHFPPENSYNSSGDAASLAVAADRYSAPARVDAFASLFGIGDGGSGPADDFVERFNRMKDWEFTPKIQFSRASEFFDHLNTFRDDLPRWVGELYLEKHRGTLTTQARTKRGNRKCEQSLAELEMMYSALPLSEYPSKDLDSMWKTLLTNQFHDILPGSSIPQVYEETESRHASILAHAEELKREAAAKLFRADSSSAVIVNSLSEGRTVTVALPEAWGTAGAVREDGSQIPAQTENGRTVIAITLPPFSFTTVRKSVANSSPASESASETGRVLENDLVRYEFSAEGTLTSAYDKEMKKEMLSGEGNVLTLYGDNPLEYDAWDIEIYYPRDSKGTLKCVSAGSVVRGPVRSFLNLVFRTEHSEVRERVILEAHSKRLDFVAEADWHETHVMLRAAFPTAIRADEATFDIQYAYIRRPTHDNTSWDQAKFEVCAHRYADLSDNDCGVALLNDCKYGCRVKGNTLDLALLRSSKEPDFFADQGEHRFTYSFLPHAKTLAESNVMKESASLNRTPWIAEGYEAGAKALPFVFESDGIALEAVKKAEKEASLVLRFVETRGRHSRGVLKLKAAESVLETTDLTEWKHDLCPMQKSGEAVLELSPFEIRTLLLR